MATFYGQVFKFCLIVISDLVACSFKNVIIYLLYSLHYGTSTFIPLVVAHLVQPLLLLLHLSEANPVSALAKKVVGES